MNDLKLVRFRWKYRLLLLFSPSIDDEAYLKQIESFQGKEAEIKDRDLIIFRFFSNGEGFCNSDIIPFEEVKRSYQDFHINKDQFNILLIGKDGGVKMHKKQYVQTYIIFNIIDQMPMRQNEMRRKSGSF